MKTREGVPLSFLLPDWLRAPALSITTAKEVREILPCGLISLVTNLVWLLSAGVRADGWAWSCWFVAELATVAMGAVIFGHEFAHRTLALMLAQPLVRGELWGRKMRVLAAALAVIAIVRVAGPVLHGNWRSPGDFAALMSLASVGFGLLIAPLFTLWSRSTLAGTVFTFALPVVTWQLARLATVVWYGPEWASAEAARQPTIAIWLVLTLAQWLAGPFLAYRAFLRLQAVEPRGVALGIPWRRWRASAAVGARPSAGHPLPRLIVKEIRLQAPAFLVTGVYLLICGADIALRRAWPPGDAASVQLPLTTLATYIHRLLVSLLIGTLACAEERRAGTLAWHLVLPMPAWRQWAVKAGAALGLALLLAVGLPALVAGVDAWANPPQRALNLQVLPPRVAGLHVLVLVTIGLYVSSVAGTPLRAVLWSVPVAGVVELVFTGILDSVQMRTAFSNCFAPFETSGRIRLAPAGVVWLVFMSGWMLLPWVVPLACAFQNFRRLDQQTSRVLVHLGVTAATLLAVAAVGAGATLLARAAEIALPLRPETRAEALAGECDGHLLLIGAAVNIWSGQHDRQVPPSLNSLNNLLPSPRLLVCPADEARVPANDWDHLTPARISYEYRVVRHAAAAPALARIRCPIHDNDRTAPVLAQTGGAPQPSAPAPTDAATLPASPPSGAPTQETPR